MPAYVEAYEAHYRLPVRFSQSRDELVFDRVLLDMPLASGFPALHRQAALRADQLVRQTPGRAGLVAGIDDAYAKDPELLGQGIEAVAARLGLHPRTLQRRLRDEGTSFAAVHDRARYRSAATSLESGENLEKISEQLGFSDRRSFTRAFRRWAGSSPSGFRRRARQKQP
jgi:AraC-like DNA-binding protein